MAAGFNVSTSVLGDAMNFPEASTVKKKEALSNIIFKITQSTEKLNKRNERLLKLNLDYELKMLRLTKQKEKMTWEKLNCDKLCSSQTKDWLFEGSNLESYKRHIKNERQSLPSLPLKQGMNLSGRFDYEDYTIRRVNTAPVIIPNSNKRRMTGKEREMKSVAEIHFDNHLQYIEDELKLTEAPLNKNNEMKTKERKSGGEEVELPKLNKHNGAISKGWRGNDREEIKEKGDTIVEWEGDGNPEVISKSEINLKSRSVVQLRNINEEKGKYVNEDGSKNKDNFTKLLEKAEISTKMLSAYIPNDPGYRRMCATRKAYENMESRRPRILTRYLREKRAFENLSKFGNKAHPSKELKDESNKQKIVLSYI